MTTSTVSHPTTASRFPPDELATLSLVSALLDLLVGAVAIAAHVTATFLHWGAPGARSFGFGAPLPLWAQLLLAVLYLVSVLLPIGALIAGLSALGRISWGSQTAIGLTALVGVILGGLEGVSLLVLLGAH